MLHYVAKGLPNVTCYQVIIFLSVSTVVNGHGKAMGRVGARDNSPFATLSTLADNTGSESPLRAYVARKVAKGSPLFVQFELVYIRERRK